MVSTTKGGEFKLSQECHAKRLKQALKGCSFELFRRYWASLSWLVLSLPSIAYSVNRAAQVMATSMKDGKVAEINKATKEARSGDTPGPQYKSLHQKFLILKMYAEAAFATNDELISLSFSSFFYAIVQKRCMC